MRRLPALVAAAVALTGAPAGADHHGELVVVADGASVGTITVPRTVALDMPRATVEGPSYAALVILRPGGQVTALGYRAPGFEEFPFGRDGDHQLQRGRSELRLLATRGRTIIRIPAPDLPGRVTVRLTKRLDGVVTEFRPLGGVVGAVRSDIPFATRGRRMLALHGALLSYAAVVEQDTRMCVVAGSEPCQEVTTEVQPGVYPSRLQVTPTLYSFSGSAHAYYSSNLLGVPQGTGQHYVLAFPLE